MSHGKIIVIEGADGTGKATVTKAVLERLNTEQPLGDAVSFRTHSFPTYQSFYGQQIRHYLEGDAADEVVQMPKGIRDDPFCAALAYAADRYVAMRDHIRPRLEQGDWFVLDRYTLSNFVHQGAKIIGAKELADFAWRIERLEYMYFDLPLPELVIILELPDKVRRQRVDKRRACSGANSTDIHEQDDVYMDRVAALYRNASLKFGEEGSTYFTSDCMEGDREQTPAEVAADVYHFIAAFIQNIDS